MGASNSKTQCTGEELQMGHPSEYQTPVQYGRTEHAPGAKLDATNQSTKRPRDQETGVERPNKKLKESDASDRVEHHPFTGTARSPTFPPHKQQVHDHLKENSPAISASRAEESLESFDDVIRNIARPACEPKAQESPQLSGLEQAHEAADDMPLANDQTLHDASILGSTSPSVASPTPAKSPTTKGSISPCASTSELSHRMDSQLSQASQAILEAAATSQDLEDAVPPGWRGASEQRISHTQREQNRQLLRDAIRELHEIKDSEIFSSESLARLTMPHPGLAGQTAVQTRGPPFADDVSEVNFVSELRDPLGAFHSPQRTRAAFGARVEEVDVRRPATCARDTGNDGEALNEHIRGCQRKLVGYWRGWDRGVLSRQAFV
ncbi:hypothetical protein M409DRAFT_26379 [Zasmidium cellare ATCC 36951]|uniref:Uncharacterized protein n=1 Tax=Zasmidium cellare ATCC 36951 TaxID=1080233 RepID=A0A6A6CBP8_ZASCE|nr:uncharacterized protein M409DRAFT_26379 [Zasmidium cellare ATCC 36951]KAF2163342.1 hypothetical protein M409DRAFT_26379 [Zasmidium cellare ATCC 36951]